MLKSIQNKIKVTPGKRRENEYESSQLTLHPWRSAKKRRCFVCFDAAGKKTFADFAASAKDVVKPCANDTFSFFATVVSCLNVCLFCEWKLSFCISATFQSY